jgi:hypothetical protein
MFQAARFAPSKASGIATAPWTITVVGFLFEFPKFCVQTLSDCGRVLTMDEIDIHSLSDRKS